MAHRHTERERVNRERTSLTVAGLSGEEREFLWIILSYPEKYWKLMNHYINGKKTWISDKNMEKLKAVKEQEQAKENFLNTQN